MMFVGEFHDLLLDFLLIGVQQAGTNFFCSFAFMFDPLCFCGCFIVVPCSM
eukprot:m.299825 g.299825  ORF g.299825 m.299825 type:complete len:51 (+) comp15874_c0_seq3:946-1098(+)